MRLRKKTKKSAKVIMTFILSFIVLFFYVFLMNFYTHVPVETLEPNVSDLSGPVLQSSNPTDGAMEAETTPSVTMSFNEPIFMGISSADIALKSGESSLGAKAVASGNVLTITPAHALASNTSYTVIVPEGAVKDADENGNDAELRIAFTTEADANLLWNPGFEQTEANGGASHWDTYVDPDVTAAFQVTDSAAAQGDRSLEMVAASLGSGDSIMARQFVSVQTGQAYLLSGQVRVFQLKNAKMQYFLMLHNAKDEWVSTDILDQLVVTNGFAKLEKKGTVPEGITRIYIGVAIRATGNDGSGTVYVDGLQLTQSPIEEEKPQADIAVALEGNSYKSIAGGNPMSLYAVQDQNKLYLLVKDSELNTQNIFYIDSDNNSTTGYQSTDWSESGIDYKIEYNSLYRYIESNSSWTKVGPVYTNITPSYVGMYLYLDRIGRDRPGAFKIAYKGKTEALMPASGSAMMLVDTTIRGNSDPAAFYPNESFEVLNNPYMGWAPSSKNSKYEQPHRLVTLSATWRKLEPVKGVFDWTVLESEYNLNHWGNLGIKAILRMVLDLPSDDAEHKDIPDWLYDELVAAEGVSNAGTWYDTSSSAGFSPNYSSPILIREHRRLIQALAHRYNHDPRIAFIQLGSIGHYGEFHNGLIDTFPELSVSDQYVQHYIDYFTNKVISMRKPFPLAAQYRLGLYNDMFGEPSSTDAWLTWTQAGLDGINVSEGQDPSRAQAASMMPEFWKYADSGGEFSSNYEVKEYFHDDRFMELLRQARLSHTSWLGATSLAHYQLGVDLEENIQANMDLLLNTMGYRFVLESIKHETNAMAGSRVTLAMQWTNKGVAPFYFSWPLEFVLAGVNGNVVSSTRTAMTSINIRNWLPGKHTEKVVFPIPKNLSSGRYTLLVAIIDPSTGKPGVHLAIEGRRNDGWYRLDEISVVSF